MPTKTTRMLACFGMFLMVLLLAADVGARGRGGGGGGRGGGGFSRGGGGFSRGGGGGMNRGGGSMRTRPSPNVSRRGPASGGTFSGGENWSSERRGGYERPATRPATRPEVRDRSKEGDQRANEDRRARVGDANDNPRDNPRDTPEREERRDEAQKRVDKRQKNRNNNRNEYYDDRNEFYDDWRHYSYGTSITVVRFDSLSCTTTSSSVGGVTYYECGGVWYNRTYTGGSVNYIVVNAPH
jgi:hypothetical protein